MVTRGFRRGATDEGELDKIIFTVSALTANISACAQTELAFKFWGGFYMASENCD